jgi:hypothetical protein
MQQVFIDSVCVTVQKRRAQKSIKKYFLSSFRRAHQEEIKGLAFFLILIFFSSMNQKFSHMFPPIFRGIGMSGDAEEEGGSDNQLLSTFIVK